MEQIHDIKKQLADLAYEHTINLLRDYGNDPSVQQLNALRRLIDTFSEITCSRQRYPQRIAFPLPCGTGKTTAIRGFCRALDELNLDYTVVVCMEMIEGLCALKRDLEGDGISQQNISLLHSKTYDPDFDIEAPKPNHASMPPTDPNDLQQFVLLSHAKLRSGFNHFGYDLLIYDESLITGEPKVEQLSEVTKLLGAYASSVDGKKEFASEEEKGLGKWCHQAKQKLLELDDGVLRYFNLPYAYDRAAYLVRKELGDKSALLNFLNQLQFDSEVRVSKSEQGRSVITYRQTIPAHFGSMVILDASHKIRNVLSYDKTVTCADIGNIKSYGNVNIFVAPAKSGRQHILDELKAGNDPEVFDEAVHLAINRASEGEDVLVFTYKHALDDLKKRVSGNVSPDVFKRINFLSWGHETAINRYSHCTCVILAGVLQLPFSQVSGLMIAQAKNIQLDWEADDLRDAVRGERVHSLYQALNRGQCRVVNHGKALPMKAYIFAHDVHDLKRSLQVVMPEANFIDYRGRYLKRTKTKTEECRELIVAYVLKQYEDGENKISSTKIFRAVGQGYGIDTRKTALAKALEHELSDWVRSGKSIRKLDTIAA